MNIIDVVTYYLQYTFVIYVLFIYYYYYYDLLLLLLFFTTIICYSLFAIKTGSRETPHVHLVSITRFPLIIFSPGAGLLRNLFVDRYWRNIFQGLGPKRRESSNGDRV